MSADLTEQTPRGGRKTLAVAPAIQQLLVLLGIVAVWQVASGRLINAYYLSTPAAVVTQIANWIADGTLWPHLAATLATTLLGFAIAACVAIPLALASRSTFERSKHLFSRPYSSEDCRPALNSLARNGQLPAIALSDGTAFFLGFSIFLGLKNVPRVYTDTAALMGASS